MKQRIQFESHGNRLAAQLEMPESEIQCYALFAHCFTCGKDIAAASRIARALTEQGIAVMRFDFTGLGNSDGDFANTNFSSNIEDLNAAVDHLRTHYKAPELLVGHSLGGAAVLSMAATVPEVKGVVTIGAPFSPDHVLHHLTSSIDEIEATGSADVQLGPRSFTIKKQFIDDLRNQDTDHIGNLRKALLVMHSPIDQTVDIGEAEKIYRQAKHPKSFVSLDDADHLISNVRDADYIAATIAGWASRYITDQNTNMSPPATGHVRVEEKDHKFAQHVYSDTHHWLADEPLSVGGTNSGPDPYEHLLAALGACTAMTLRMYANRKKLALDHVEVELRHSRSYADDCENCGDSNRQIEVISRTIKLIGRLTMDQQERLLEIADRCPVHRTLHSELKVLTELE